MASTSAVADDGFVFEIGPSSSNAVPGQSNILAPKAEGTKKREKTNATFRREVQKRLERAKKNQRTL